MLLCLPTCGFVSGNWANVAGRRLRGESAALEAGDQFLELGAEALGLRRLTMPNHIRQKPFQLLG